jgi:hypothetical protein
MRFLENPAAIYKEARVEAPKEHNKYVGGKEGEERRKQKREEKNKKKEE